MELTRPLPLPVRLEKWICPFPGAKEARAIGVFALIVAFLMCGLSLYYGWRGETFMGRPLGSDFVQFYAVGKVFNQYPASSIYDAALVGEVEHQSLPTMPTTQILLYSSGPHLAFLFSPLAKLSYFSAYCVWLLFSFAVYVIALWVLLHNRFGPGINTTAFLLALSVPVYLFETWIGGQLSVLTFAAVVLFFRALENRRFFLAGMAAGLVCYKPTLLLIPAAAMLLGLCWRMLAGLCVSVLATTAATAAFLGAGIFPSWIAGLIRTGRLISAAHATKLAKNVDLSSFAGNLFGFTAWSQALAMAALFAAFVALAWLWRINRGTKDQRLLWAVTWIAATGINVYFPVYDALIIVPALVVIASCLEDTGLQKTGAVTENLAFRGWLTLLWLSSWFTQPAAEFTHVQVLTLALAAFAFWAAKLAILQSRPIEI